MTIKILIATHKICNFPTGSIYLPVQVGKALHPELSIPTCKKDNEGNHISEKNPYYCELTAIYWAWKNLKADFIGLTHYRRYFCLKRKSTKWDSILNDLEAKSLCNDYDIILPKKRKLYIETVYSHYNHTFYGEHFDKTRAIIADRCPEYLNAFDRHMKERSQHLFNMFIMKESLFHQYCLWLFPILQELEKTYDLSRMDPFQARLIGRVSERLLDVWIQRNNLNYKEIDFLYFGEKHIFRKVWGFAMAVLFHRRYKRSF